MIEPPIDPRWLAVYTKARHEKVAYEQLTKQGMEVYLPLVRSKRRWSDRTKWVDVPLFRSYLFVRIPLKDHLFVLQTIGVHHVVKFKSEIAVIPDEQIEAIRLMIEGGYDMQSTEYFQIGDRVEVSFGPMKGVQGEVSRIDGEDKFVLKIDAIQHAIAVHIERGYLKAVN